jgi:hypothetical protein
MSASGLNLVDFVLRLLAANKEQLLRVCGSTNNASMPLQNCRMHSYQPHAAADHTKTVVCVDSESHSGFHIPPAAVGGSVGHAERTRELNLQIDSLNARIQDLEAQLAASALSLSQLSLLPTSDGHGAPAALRPSPSAASSSPVAAVDPNDPSFLKCTSAVVNGLKRHDTKFLRQVFERHKDGSGSLPACNVALALTEADAPVIPESVIAAAGTIARFDSNSNGLMEFGEFERAINLPDELALYFQEKRQPLLADALRALVGRGGDQLLRVSQLSPSDVRAAYTAVGASLPQQAGSLF